MKHVLFLGYGPERTRLIDRIAGCGWRVEWTDGPIADLSPFDAVVSFGYRHILRKAVLDTARRPVLNLHISYLPWNRGAHPLFWAAFDGTPAGVTIHEIDEGVDTGPICLQKRLTFDLNAETFESAYKRAIDEIEALFAAHASALLSGDYASRPQTGQGGVKRARDLPAGFSWADPIGPTIQRLKQAAPERPSPLPDRKPAHDVA